jgi:hypothetical protein
MAFLPPLLEKLIHRISTAYALLKRVMYNLCITFKDF